MTCSVVSRLGSKTQNQSILSTFGFFLGIDKVLSLPKWRELYSVNVEACPPRALITPHAFSIGSCQVQAMFVRIWTRVVVEVGVRVRVRIETMLCVDSLVGGGLA